MRSFVARHLRVLAVDPYDRGFGYVLLSGPNDLLDWGITAADRRKTTRYLPSLKHLVERFAPDILITEDGARQGSGRRRDTRVLLKRIRRFAKHIGFAFGRTLGPESPMHSGSSAARRTNTKSQRRSPNGLRNLNPNCRGRRYA